MVAIIADPATKPCAKSSVSAKMRILPDLPDPMILNTRRCYAASTSAIGRAPPVPAANHSPRMQTQESARPVEPAKREVAARQSLRIKMMPTGALAACLQASHRV